MTRQSKYGNKPASEDGLNFDSQAERGRYRELVFLQRAGAISELGLHPRFIIVEGYNKRDGSHVRPVYYEADFMYVENGTVVVEDVKGVATQVFKLKRKLFERRYPQYEFRLVEV
jgi:hypothetical protein